MTEHLSPSFLELFRNRSLSAASLARATLHLEECPDCHRKWRESGCGRRGGDPDEPVRLLGRRDWGDLAWLADEHPGSLLVARYVQRRLCAEDLEMVELHLRHCPVCREGIRLARSAGLHRAPASISSPAPAAISRWLALLIILAAVSAGAIALRLIHEVQPTGQPTAAPVPEPRQQARQVTPDPALAPVRPAIRSSSPIPSIPAGAGGRFHRASGRPLSGHSASSDLVSKNPVGKDSVGKDPVSHRPVVINDGGRIIKLELDGRLTGLDELTPTERRWITGVLQREELPDSRVMRLQLAESPRLRAPLAERSEQTDLRLLAPLPEVLVDTRPVLVWTPQADAASYQIELREIGGRQILLSPELEGEIDQWQLPAPLRRGSAWRAVLRIRLTADPLTRLVSRPRLFSILGERELAQLASLRARTSSHLARGLLYARWGLVSEARREIEMLEEQNRESLLIKRFLLNLLAESYHLN